VRIMRTSMTTLTQTWMTLLLSNVQPSDQNSDLPLPKCQLVYAILTRMRVHAAQVIADAIYLFAGMPPTRHPLDPDKSKRALGFPALITGLCQSFGVPVAPSKVIQPPITWAFIKKYCTPRQAQAKAHQAADAPPPPHQACYTLILSGYHFLMACNLWLTASRYLAPFVSQYVKFRGMPEIKMKHCYAIREIP